MRMSANDETIYLKIDQNVLVSDRNVTLGDIASITSSNETMARQLKQKKIYSFRANALCILVFFGGAFTIMSFNNDIGITELFGKFYYQVMGAESSGFTELEISYCIGISIGILVFFNHFGKKKFTPDPTPVQVQMRQYEEEVDTTFIENSGRGGNEEDVG